MPTVLITGCSSGFGLETARHFEAQGWNVIATMRHPRADLLPKSDRLKIVKLDVTDPASIQETVAAAGTIDVLVNNAGIGFLNALEGTPMDTIREIFETNTLGTIAMTKAVLPQMRERGSGVIVNVSSSTTLKDLPLLSVYAASKAAVNAFSKALAEEMKSFGVRVVAVLPGRAPTTSFSDNARTRLKDGFPEAYSRVTEAVFAGWQQEGETTSASDVAEAIWKVVSDPASPSLIPAGADAITWLRESRE